MGNTFPHVGGQRGRAEGEPKLERERERLAKMEVALGEAKREAAELRKVAA